MSDPYFYSDEVARFQVLLEEVTRAKPGSPETRFIRPEGNAMDRLASTFHHVLYGRRGTGKSSLLRRIESDHRASGKLVAWVDQETYMGLSYPDVLVGTLADAFKQFSHQIRALDTAPKRRTRLLGRTEPTRHAAAAAALDQAVAQLLDLKHAPSQASIEWTASFSQSSEAAVDSSVAAEGKKGPLGVKFSKSRKNSEKSNHTGGIAHRYTATKAEHLEKAVSTYRDLMCSVVELVPDPFIVLDDFYRLADSDQPMIAGYFHRIVKDTGAWLKFGSIKYWTRLYAGGSPAVGLQVPHDIRELSLDRGLLDFKTSKRFLEEILSTLASECGAVVSRLFTNGALDRLVLAAGGVPRDYIGLVSEAVAVAKNRGASNKAGTDRVIAEDVNEAAGRTVETKLSDLVEDAGDEADELKDLVIDITNHCRRTGSACFLVDFRNSDLVSLLNRLQTMRFVHSIDDNETLPDQQSSRYNVYVLDVSQLAAQRAWQVDFMGWTKRERRRARKLVFSREDSAEPELTSLASNPQLGFAIDDSLAIVTQIDGPAGGSSS